MRRLIMLVLVAAAVMAPAGTATAQKTGAGVKFTLSVSSDFRKATFRFTNLGGSPLATSRVVRFNGGSSGNIIHPAALMMNGLKYRVDERGNYDVTIPKGLRPGASRTFSALFAASDVGPYTCYAYAIKPVTGKTIRQKCNFKI